jgi:hypothetical protein
MTEYEKLSLRLLHIIAASVANQTQITGTLAQLNLNLAGTTRDGLSRLLLEQLQIATQFAQSLRDLSNDLERVLSNRQ